MLITYEGIDRNFTFLVLEVRKQLELTFALLQRPAESLVRGILSRDNYMDTLKSLIEKKTLTFFRHSQTLDKMSTNAVSALNVATTNLERIGDFCTNIANQVQRIQNPEFLSRFDFKPHFTQLLRAINLVTDAFEQQDTSVALELCRYEEELDALYYADFDRIRNELRAGQHTDEYLAVLYIAHYLERMGDALLNIGEAALFAASGERLKLHEYDRVNEALAGAHPDQSVGEFTIDFNWETRSGSRIAKVEERKRDGGEFEAIFKKGHADKIRKERANIERWGEIMPGLPPRLLEFNEGETDATLLLEFLDGYTLRDIVVNGDADAIDEAVHALSRVIRTVWRATKRDEPVQPNFIRQVIDRLDDIYRLHPEFATKPVMVHSLRMASFGELLNSAADAEKAMTAPFTVLIHGDFNTDNVIYNRPQKSIHLIDLYRSRESDYVQDVSVFLVSNFRVPVFGGEVRESLNRVSWLWYQFARSFADEMGDTTFDARLSLGLARSFLTSTRFEVDDKFAKKMYERAEYLLRDFVEHSPDRLDKLKPKKEILLY